MSTVATKLYWSFRLRGVVETGLHYANAAIGRLLKRDASCDPLRRSELAFDKRFGVQTAGVVETDSLGLPVAAASHSVEYRPSSEVSTAVALAALPIDRTGFHFVDVGCGRGRVLLIGDMLGFRRVTGVELSPHLAADARRNLAAVAAQQSSRGLGEASIALLEQDATTIALPEESLVIYMYNPFDAEILQRFLVHVERSLEAAPRECWIVYANAIHRDVIDSATAWAEHKYGDEWWGVYRYRTGID